MPDEPFTSDVFAAAVPESYDLTDPEQFPVLFARMTDIAEMTTLAQFEVAPRALLFEPIDWLVVVIFDLWRVLVAAGSYFFVRGVTDDR